MIQNNLNKNIIALPIPELLIGGVLYDYSIGYTNDISIENSDWCTPYTIEGELVTDILVSKYIDHKKDIQMNNLTTDERPLHVYFKKDIPESYDSDYYTKLEPTLKHKTICCATWNEMADAFKLKPKSICVNSDQIENQSLIEILNMFKTFMKLLGNLNDVSVTLGVNKDTPYKLVKEAQKLNIIGIIPASKDFGMEETMKAFNAQLNDIPYWPKHIIEQLPGAKKPEIKIKSNEIKLTPRQSQILNLIKDRGASNKVIAKTLNITESTVKLHVSIVLRKFGVKNRTQLALFSK